MKISKSGLLNLSLVFTVLGLGLVAVSMAQRQLYVDLNNASQYMEKIKFISTGSTDSAFLEQIGNGSVKIQTNNFILSKTGNDENVISGGYYSSILGGIKNKIEGKGTGKIINTIIGGSENLIKGKYNVILGGEGNNIENGEYSVIVGGKDNILSGNYSVILGSNNTLEGSQSTVVGKSGYVKGNYSTALGKNSKIEANNSFLWTDGSTTETLTQNNVFVVMAKSGMIINTNQAHNFAKLTIGGPLIVSSKNTDENIQCGAGEGGGILKVKNAGSQKCLCSCDGSGRNSMLGKGKCMGICDSSIKPQCDNDVQRIKVGDHIEYSGSCNFGVPAKGTGAYLVTKDDKVHWSCQTDDGQVVGCSGTATGLPYKTCGTAPSGEGIKLGNSSYVEGFGGGNTTWTYTESENPGTCEYTCTNGYHRNGNTCVNRYECTGDAPGTNNTKIGSTTTTDPNHQEREYVEYTNTELGACQWSCISNAHVRGTGENKMDCILLQNIMCSNPMEHFLCEGGDSTDNVTGSTEWTWKCGDNECMECFPGYEKRVRLDGSIKCERIPDFAGCCSEIPNSGHQVLSSEEYDGCYFDNLELPPRGRCVRKTGYGCAGDGVSNCGVRQEECGGDCCTRQEYTNEEYTLLIGEIREYFKCDTGTHLVGCKCVNNSRRYPCPSPGIGYQRCGDGKFTQNWYEWESIWIPSTKATTYNKNCTDTKDCSYKCNRNYGYNSSEKKCDSCSNLCEGNYYYFMGTCYKKTCFIAGTKVTMEDGSKKNIEDIKIGEKVLGSNGSINTVLGYDRPVLGDRHLRSINGSKYFVSDEHPFMTTEGWKSFNPEMTKLEIDLDTTKLRVGDILITENGLEEIKSLDYIDANYNTPLYNIMLNGDHTYYANDYLVHNKQKVIAYELDGSCPRGTQQLGNGCCSNGGLAMDGYCNPACN